MGKKSKVRVNFRLDPKLVTWVKRYAKKKSSTATSVVEHALRGMKKVADGDA